MTFNKFIPDEITPTPEAPSRRLRRARVLRYAWLVSTLMLVGGYVLAALLVTGRLDLRP